MKYDDVLSQLGDFGRYQQIVYTAICIPLMFEAMQLMSPVFILAVPKYRCAIPGIYNDTYNIQDSYHADLIDAYIPITEAGDYSKCQIYTCTYADGDGDANRSLLTNETRIRQKTDCDRWVYDQTDFLDTVITETNLVCTRTIYRAHATMAMNVGALIGYVAIGTIADKFGRKQATTGELVVMGLFSCLLLWLPNIYMFIVIRLFIGIGFGVFYNSCFIYAMEIVCSSTHTLCGMMQNLFYAADILIQSALAYSIHDIGLHKQLVVVCFLTSLHPLSAMEVVGPSKRTLCGMLQNFFWAAGILIQSALAYSIRSWRLLQLAISLPIFGVLMYWWYIPNSGRWLMSTGRRQQCEKIFKRMAKVNQKHHFDLDLLTLQEEKSVELKQESFWKIFKSRTLTVRTLIVLWNWYTVSLLYYGLSFNVANLSGSIYSNFAISCVMEVVGYILCFPGLYYLKRKRFHCTCMITGGLVVLASILPQVYGTDDTKWSIILLAMVGKLVSSAAYATIYLFSAELFPTVIRSRTMGISAAFATLGAMTAPYIVELVNLLDGQLATIMPFLIFGVTSLSAGIVSIVLPETHNVQLPDTIDEMKRLGKGTT